jgi:hypothetical protein
MLRPPLTHDYLLEHVRRHSTRPPFFSNVLDCFLHPQDSVSFTCLPVPPPNFSIHHHIPGLTQSSNTHYVLLPHNWPPH